MNEMKYYEIAVAINEICQNDITAENLKGGANQKSGFNLPGKMIAYICTGIEDGLLTLMIDNKYGLSAVDNAFLKSKMIEYFVNKYGTSIQSAYDVIKIFGHLSEMHYQNLLNISAAPQGVFSFSSDKRALGEERIFKDSSEEEFKNQKKAGNTYDPQMGYYVYNGYF